MIRILPALYIASALLCAVGFVVFVATVLVSRTRRFFRPVIWIVLTSVALLTISVLALSGFCQRLEARAKSISSGASRSEVLARLGSPSERYKDDAPMPDGSRPDLAVWYYEVRVFPFQEKYRFEFVNDKLLSSSAWSQ